MHRHIWQKPKQGDVFKFCRCGKSKKIAKSIIDIRKEKFEQACVIWKTIAHERDGNGCQIQKHFPHLNLKHSNMFQIDHFHPRGIHSLFFEVSNATKICSTCNYLKSNGSPQSTLINYCVQEIVLRREGQEKFSWLNMMADKNPLVRDFKREWWCDEKILELTDYLDNMRRLHVTTSDGVDKVSAGDGEPRQT